MKNISILIIIVISILCLPLVAYNKQIEDYKILQQHFSTWFVDQKRIPDNFEVKGDAIIANEKIVSGGEFSYQSNRANCIAYAPHRFFDKYTFQIAQHLFRNHCQLFITNSLHRNTTDQNDNKIDLAKYPFSAANALVTAYSKKVNQYDIYQIHGFTTKKRKTLTAKNADVIISQGGATPSPKAYAISQCLKDKLDFNSLVYPEQVSELGGTKNIINVIASENSQFFHIEINYFVRSLLVKKPTLLRVFNLCLTS